ncbi:MAG: DNA polymerase III subunit beta [Bacilli bacterium]|jgi:DNA polymerase-3 subunit beta
MRLTINREQLLKGLTIAAKAIGSKVPVPLLMNLKLVLNEKGLTIIGGNNELTINTLVPNMIGEREIIRNAKYGATLVASKIITEIARRMEGEELAIEVVDETIVKIDDGKSSFKLNSIRADEYPEVDLEPTGVVFELPCQDFAKLVDQTAFAASNKEQRPILTAVNLEASSGKLIATATDSARLARKEISVDDVVSFSSNVPARTLVEITKMFESAHKVTLAVSDKKILFSFDNTLVSSRLINGEYPNTKNIIPKTFNYFLEVNSQELISAMERASLLSVERENVVKLSMTEDALEVASKSAQVGSANEKISTFQFSGDRLEMSFNSEYVIAAIRAVKAEDVTVAFIGEMKPFVIKNSKDDSVVQLVTPVRTF